jgi:hypothetical protein
MKNKYKKETPAEIEAIRAALIEGEKSGFCNQSIDEIWEEALNLKTTVE